MEKPWWDPSQIERQLPDEEELAAQDRDIWRILQEQRAHERAVSMTRILNGATWFSMLGIFGIFETCTWLLAPICLALPLLAFAVAFRYPEQLRLDEPVHRFRGWPRSNLAFTCYCSPLMAVLFAGHTPLLDRSVVFLFVPIGFAIAFPAVCSSIDRSVGALSLAGMTFMGALYGYAAAVESNVLFDGAKPSVVEAPIVDRELRRSKRGEASYYLRVAVPDAATITVPVSDRQYARCTREQKMVLRIHPGALGGRWYEIQRVCSATDRT